MITLTEVELSPCEIQQDKNWRVAQAINRETRANPNSIYVGKYVGVWNEEIVTVGDTLDEACEAVDAMGETAASECCVIEASADYDAKIMFWSWA